MPLRFRKRIKLFPGVHINLSGSGISASIGKPGATINLKSGRKARATIGMPGTGISDSFDLEEDEPGHHEENSGGSIFGLVILAVMVLGMFAVAYVFASIFMV